MVKHESFVTELIEMLAGPVKWTIVAYAIEQQIFDRCQTPASAQTLSQHVGGQPEPVALLLDALCSLGFLAKQNNAYINSPAAEHYLVSSAKHYIGLSLLHFSQTRHAGLQQLSEILNGVTPDALHLNTHQFWRNSAHNLHVFQQSVSCHEQLNILETLPEWPKINRVLDLGAGSEALALAINARYPEKHITLFDLPACIDQMALRLARSEHTHIQLHAGDYNHFALTGHYDLIWSSLTLYYAKNLEQLLRTIRARLNAGGIFISVHEGLEHERTHPREHVIGRLFPALLGNDLSFNRDDIHTAMQTVGFVDIESRKVQTCFGTVWVDIGHA